MKTLLLSDVHANTTALNAVLAAAGDVDRVLFLGDAVDVGPQPDAAVSKLRRVTDDRVIGNHDRLVLGVAPDAATDDEYERWKQWTLATVSDENLAHLKAAPRTTVATVGDNRFRLHHGDFEPPDEDDPWTTRATPEDARHVFETVAGRYDEEYVLLGHSHRPFVTDVDGTTFVNPGSVGLQRGDMRSDVAWYAVFDGDSFDLRTTTYDVDEVISACETLPLADEFVESWTENYRRDESE